MFGLVTLVASLFTVTYMDENSNWCFQERELGASETLTDVEIYPVRSRWMAGAIRDLNERTFVELSPAQAGEMRLSWSRPQRDGQHHYLVRASVYASEGAGVDELLARSQDAVFEIEWLRGSRRARIVTIQAIPSGRVRAQNIAMILSTDVSISHVVVACYPIR